MARALCVVLADDPGQLLAHLGTQRLGTGTSPTLDYQLGKSLALHARHMRIG